MNDEIVLVDELRTAARSGVSPYNIDLLKRAAEEIERCRHQIKCLQQQKEEYVSRIEEMQRRGM